MQVAADHSPCVADDSCADRATPSTRAIGRVTAWLGSFPAIMLSVGVVVVWFSGALFVRQHLANNTYQLLINTGTTIVTFIMVFIIQNTQNRDGRALQAKMDAQAEVIYAIAKRVGAEENAQLLINLVGVEDAPERKIERKQQEVRDIAIAAEAAEAAERG